MRKKYNYTKIEQIKEIDKFIDEAGAIFDSSVDNFSDDNLRKMASGDIKISGKEFSPAMKGLIGGTMAGVGTAAGIGGAAGTVAGSSVIGGSFAVTALGGTAAAAGTVAALPVLLVAVPAALAVGGIAGGLFSHIQNKKDKDRLREELQVYQKIAKKQNEYVHKYMELKDKVEGLLRGMKEKDEYVRKLKNKLAQCEAVLQKMVEYFNNMDSDLRTGGVLPDE